MLRDESTMLVGLKLHTLRTLRDARRTRWRGIKTRLENISQRCYYYDDVMTV